MSSSSKVLWSKELVEALAGTIRDRLTQKMEQAERARRQRELMEIQQKHNSLEAKYVPFCESTVVRGLAHKNDIFVTVTVIFVTVIILRHKKALGQIKSVVQFMGTNQIGEPDNFKTSYKALKRLMKGVLNACNAESITLQLF